MNNIHILYNILAYNHSKLIFNTIIVLEGYEILRIYIYVYIYIILCNNM